MTVNIDEAERRLRETFRHIAEETTMETIGDEVAAPSSAPTPVTSLADARTARTGRSMWLTVAAAAVVAVIGFGAWSLADRGTTTEADLATEGDAVPDLPVDETPPAAGLTLTPDPDGLLYVVPGEGWTVELDGAFGPPEFASGEAIGPSEEGRFVLVGRPTESGYTDLVPIYAPAAGTYNVERSISEEIAGRTLYESFDEGVVEEFADGTTLIYQLEFDDEAIEEIVAATRIEDGRIEFDGTPSGIELLDDLDAGALDRRATARGDVVVDGRSATVMMTTDVFDQATDPALVGLALLNAPVATAVEIGGAPGYAFGIEDLDGAGAPPGEELTILAWEPIPDHVVMLWVALDRASAIEFAERLRSADKSTWESYWSAE